MTLRSGFTLIELLISIALIVILTGVYIMVANPAGQLAASRNNERQLHLQTLLNVIRQNIADQTNEQFSCAAGPLPTTTPALMASQAGVGDYNIAPCLIPSYGIFTMPFDPSASSSYFKSVTDYNSGYTIIENASGSITLSAPHAELGQDISITR